MSILLRILRYSGPTGGACADVSCHDPGDAAVADQPWADRQRSGCRAGAENTSPLSRRRGITSRFWSPPPSDRRAGGSAYFGSFCGAMGCSGLAAGSPMISAWTCSRTCGGCRSRSTTTRVGQLMSRGIGDIDEIRFFAGVVIGDIINLVVLLTGVYGIMFSISTRLTLLFLIPLPLLFVIAYLFGVRLEPYFGKIRSARAEMYARIQENLSQMMVVKAFTREPFARQQFQEDNTKVLTAWMRVARLYSLSLPTIWFVVSFLTFLMLFFGGRWVIDDRITLGTLVAFNLVCRAAQPADAPPCLHDRRDGARAGERTPGLRDHRHAARSQDPRRRGASRRDQGAHSLRQRVVRPTARARTSGSRSAARRQL